MPGGEGMKTEASESRSDSGTGVSQRLGSQRSSFESLRRVREKDQEFVFFEQSGLLVRILRTNMTRGVDIGEEWMRVISKTRLRQFWESSGNEDSAGPLRAWHTHVSLRCVAWRSWSDVKLTFGSASLVGNCVVFNIGGNKYRLVTRILYPSQKVFILKIMTHVEYDQDTWKDGCGCYQPPPKKSKTTDATPTAKPKKRGS